MLWVNPLMTSDAAPSKAKSITSTRRIPGNRTNAAIAAGSANCGSIIAKAIASAATGGEILNSTYFSVSDERASDGALTQLVFDGRGYGHGVGMCQWGAIGRARAGQDFRTILRTYYPGTALGVVQ